MRRIILFLCLVPFACALTSPVSAQDIKGRFNVSPGFGLVFPMGDFADDDWVSNEDALYRKMGYQFGAGFEYFFNPYFGGGLQFRYVSLGSKDYDILDDPKQDDKLSIMMFGVCCKVMFLPDGKVRPYGRLGFGIMRTRISDFPAVDWSEDVYYISDIELDNKMYIQFGAGLAVFMSPRISLFGELTFDNLRYDGAEGELTDLPGASDPEVETNYNAFDLLAGVNIWFGGTE